MTDVLEVEVERNTVEITDVSTTVTVAQTETSVEIRGAAGATGAAGGVLSGTYPNPGFAVDMATQAELDAVVAAAVMDGDPAGGVLSGTYPNPGFAVDMATQAELDAAVALRVLKAGDTMTGSLLISGAVLNVTGDGAVTPYMLQLGANQQAVGGNVYLIDIPATCIRKGQGVDGNVLCAFRSSGITEVNSAQTGTLASTFLDFGTFRETGAITGSHLLMHRLGFLSLGLYEIAHNATSTAAVPYLAGFASSPRAKRAAGSTGSTEIDVMAGFITNPVNPLVVALGLEQINAGLTVNTYAHFRAESGITNALVKAGGTLSLEVGLDLQNINVGSSKISIRSTGPDAKLRHAGDGVFGAYDTISMNLGGTAHQPTLLILNESHVKDVGFVKFNSAYPSNYVLARAKGTKASPAALMLDDYIGSFEFWGWDGTTFEQGAWFGAKVWGNVSTGDLPTGFRFWVRPAGAANPDNALDIKSNKVISLNGRRAVYVSNVYSGSLSADQNNYDPEGVGSGNTPRLVWRLTANSTARTITGILAPAFPSLSDYQWLYIINVGATYNVILAHENAGSSVGNRIVTPTGASVTLAPNHAATLIYDQTTARWRLIGTNT